MHDFPLDSANSPGASSPTVGSIERKREPSDAGRLMLKALKSCGLTQTAAAELIGIDVRYLWEIIWDRRPIPMARLDRIVAALRMGGDQRDALIVADARDRHRRSRARAKAA